MLQNMKIGEVADRTGLSLRTIRHYDECGLVVPSQRTPGGFRMYTEGDVARLLVIKRMKPLGYTLDEMGALLDTLDELGGAWLPGVDCPAYAKKAVTLSGPQERADRLRRLAEIITDADERLSRLRTHAEMAAEFAHTLRYQAARHTDTAAGPGGTDAALLDSAASALDGPGRVTSPAGT